jgi:UDP-N-acetylmuramate dehydrogenase
MLEKENYSLKRHNTFHIDVLAEKYIEIFTEEELLEVCRSYSEGFFLLGGGSNILLMNDLNLVVRNSIQGIRRTDEDSDHVYVTIGAGVTWNDAVDYAVERNLGGIENLILIPGTTGAAPIQNIGAYGQELKDTFHSLNAVFIKSCIKKTFFRDDCRFGYRNSIFKQELKGEVVITSVTLKLKKNPVPEISYSSVKNIIEKDDVDDVTIQRVSGVIADIRRSKLPDPDVIGNAGSFFKNPEIDESHFIKLKEIFPDIVSFKGQDKKVKLAAGWLIEKCGWKGVREGETGSHKDQALVLVNYGNAKGLEIIEFARKIKHSVTEKFGVELEEEVNIIR